MGEISHKNHSLILESGKNLSLSGIGDVLGFNEEEITFSGEFGLLFVKGENLHISKLSLETGEVSLDGNINALVYSQKKPSDKGLISRLFR